MKLLRIDASIQGPRSASSALADLVTAEFVAGQPEATLQTRHLGADPLPSDLWATAVGASFTPEADRSPEQTAAVARAKAKDPKGYAKTANAKLLAQLEALVWDIIPADPAHPSYRQGVTLGPAHKHWFRAKFGGGRFRLFFRYDSKAKVIVYAWVNDETTLRSSGSKSDPYAVFEKMLGRGNPPDDLPATPGEEKAGATVQEPRIAFRATNQGVHLVLQRWSPVGVVRVEQPRQIHEGLLVGRRSDRQSRK